MSFTINEKLAMVQLLDLIVTSDEKISPDERDFMELIMNDLEINVDSIDDIRKRDINLSLEIVKKMSKENKEGFRELIINMANVDGSFHIREKAFISLITAVIL